MKNTTLITGFCAIFIAGTAMGQANLPKQRPLPNHKIIVEEVIQTKNYTYLHVKETDSMKWLAVPLMEASKGQIYYYCEGLSMKDFESKELNRKFTEVLFLGGVSPEPIGAEKPKMPADNMHKQAGQNDAAQPYVRKASPEVRQNVKIDAPKDCISIGQLLDKKSDYAGKTIKIKGQVTKFSPEIMDKNWIHLQDGTENNGKFDLTITSKNTVKTGDIIILEGKVTLNKDFGYGYKFDVMLEDAVLK